MQPDIIEVLYEKYYHSTYIYVFTLCRNKETAEDIVSEAFEKAFLSLPDDHRGFQYWLLVVCKNLWISRIRKEGRILPDTEDMVERIPAGGHTPESGYLDKEKNQIIYECICTLPLRYKEVLTLHYYAQLTMKEIGDLLQISQGNARTLVCRARGKLKSVLEGQGYEF